MRVPLTCAHELDVARHAHDQAPVRKAVNQLPAPTLILRSGNPGRDLALFDFHAHAIQTRQRVVFR
jgi:hypothetical protein